MLQFSIDGELYLKYKVEGPIHSGSTVISMITRQTTEGSAKRSLSSDTSRCTARCWPNTRACSRKLLRSRRSTPSNRITLTASMTGELLCTDLRCIYCCFLSVRIVL